MATKAFKPFHGKWKKNVQKWSLGGRVAVYFDVGGSVLR